jgi:hypothetical protein
LSPTSPDSFPRAAQRYKVHLAEDGGPAGFRLEFEVNVAFDDWAALSEGASETTQLIGGPMRRRPHSFFMTGHRSVWHRSDILAIVGRVPVQGCLQFDGINSDHMPP